MERMSPFLLINSMFLLESYKLAYRLALCSARLFHFLKNCGLGSPPSSGMLTT